MNILLLGKNGQVGWELQRSLAPLGRVIALDRRGEGSLCGDLADLDGLAATVRAVQPQVIVNAAAHTAVDRAQAEPELAERINAQAPAVLARAAAACGALLLHYSTDYVFDGSGQTPWQEGDATGPLSVYGRTKLAGELAVAAALPGRSYVVRTAWLYGEHGANFVKTMIRLESEMETVSVVDDQRGQPTWSHDLGAQILALIAAEADPGIYHGTNSGAVTWFGFTREIFRLIGADPQRVLPTNSEAFRRPAPRPANSVLGHARWAQAGIPEMRPWEEALAEAMPALRG